MDYSGGDATTEPSTERPPEPPQRKAAHYLFHGQTTSLCETCLEPVPAKVIIEDEQRLLPEALPRSTACRRR